MLRAGANAQAALGVLFALLAVAFGAAAPVRGSGGGCCCMWLACTPHSICGTGLTGVELFMALRAVPAGACKLSRMTMPVLPCATTRQAAPFSLLGQRRMPNGAKPQPVPGPASRASKLEKHLYHVEPVFVGRGWSGSQNCRCALVASPPGGGGKQLQAQKTLSASPCTLLCLLHLLLHMRPLTVQGSSQISSFQISSFWPQWKSRWSKAECYRRTPPLVRHHGRAGVVVPAELKQQCSSARYHGAVVWHFQGRGS